MPRVPEILLPRIGRGRRFDGSASMHLLTYGDTFRLAATRCRLAPRPACLAMLLSLFPRVRPTFRSVRPRPRRVASRCTAPGRCRSHAGAGSLPPSPPRELRGPARARGVSNQPHALAVPALPENGGNGG